MMHFTLKILFGVLALVVTTAMAQDIDPAKGWHEAPVTLMDVDYVGTGFHARWEYFRCDCGDALVRLEETAPDGVLTGEMIVVGGKVIAARGPVAAGNDLQAQIQAPTLMLQLAYGLMQRAMPGGPARVTAETAIDVQEPAIAIELSTGMADGRFAAPWSLKGRAWASSSSQRRFKLEFEFTNPDPAYTGPKVPITFTGGQDYAATAFPVQDELSLEGWHIQWFTKGETTASPAPDGLTLGQLRAEAAATELSD